MELELEIELGLVWPLNIMVMQFVLIWEAAQNRKNAFNGIEHNVVKLILKTAIPAKIFTLHIKVAHIVFLSCPYYYIGSQHATISLELHMVVQTCSHLLIISLLNLYFQLQFLQPVQASPTQIKATIKTISRLFTFSPEMIVTQNGRSTIWHFWTAH